MATHDLPASDLPGNDDALCSFCRPAQEGRWGAAIVLGGIEATPLDEIPGVNRVIKQIPGIDKPFRAANPDFPPNSTIVDVMNNMNICTSTDCSEIAEDLFNIAGGEGEILRVKPSELGNLNVLEDGNVVKYYYHEVYTDGRYVYDPKLSSEAVPKGDWESMMRGMNPGASIKPKKDGSDALDDVFRNP